MSIWLIEPRDPLIVRDARPFGPNPGARAKSLTFPFPSTIAGGVRTNAGKDSVTGIFNKKRIDDVKKVGVYGPVLAQLSPTGNIEQWLLPAPADALLLKPSKEGEKEKARLRQLQPVAYPTGADSNLPAGLLPVGLPQPEKSKPHKDAPQFWYWKHFSAWLMSPQEGEVALDALGLRQLSQDRRMHVAIKRDTLTGDDGALFSTSGLEFTHVPSVNEIPQLSERKRLALAVQVANMPADLQVDEGIASLGGERRMMRWQSPQEDVSLPEVPPDVLNSIKKTKHCRVILLTPAYFEQGWRPTWLCEEREGVKVTLKAAAVDTPQVVSGWDFVAKGPKPTRRLAPAGSVYYLKIEGSPEAIAAWVKAIWFKNVSDKEEDRLAGFGLAAVGIWDGQSATLQIKKGG